MNLLNCSINWMPKYEATQTVTQTNVRGANSPKGLSTAGSRRLGVASELTETVGTGDVGADSAKPIRLRLFMCYVYPKIFIRLLPLHTIMHFGGSCFHFYCL